MSQNNVNYGDNPTGPQLMDNYLAKTQENSLTTNSGIQRPTYAKAGTFWINSSANPWILYFYNGSKDVEIGRITTGSSGAFTVTGIDDSNLVHKTGNESIAGVKSFTDNLKINAQIIKPINLVRGTNPSASQYSNIYISDSTGNTGDNNAFGNFRTYVSTTGTVRSVLTTFKNTTAGTNYSVQVEPTYDTPNNRYYIQMAGNPLSTDTNWSLSRVTSDTSANTIPTMGWVNNPATSTNVVHRSGDETIGGVKTVTATYPIIHNNTGNAGYPLIVKIPYSRDTAPTSETNRYIGMYDNRSGNVGASSCYSRVIFTLKTDNTSGVALSAFKTGDTTGYDSASIGIFYPPSGNPYTSAPTPATSDNSTKIATTAYVRSHIQLVSALPASPIAGVLYCIAES